MKKINLPAIFLCWCFLLISPVCSQEKTDVIVMKNGDRMTCEIKGLEGGVLYLKLDYVDGTISVDWSKVARIESKRLFIVKTENGEYYTGGISTTDAAGSQPTKIDVAAAADQHVQIDRSMVITIGETSDNFWKRFSGDINLGMSYSKGNQSTEYNLGSYAVYERERWNVEAGFDSNLSSNSGSTTTRRNQLTMQVNRRLRWKNYFSAGGVSFLQS